MKFVIAVHGTRGDVEPAAAVGLELRGRGHDVVMAVPPNLIAFTESVGLAPVLAYGPDSQKQLDADLFQDRLRARNPVKALAQTRDYLTDGWAGMSETLDALAAGADLILTGTTYQEVAANVAESHGIAMAALHYFPARANSHILPFRLPGPVVRAGWAVGEWALWRLIKPAEDEQRRVLGLPPARYRTVRRIVEHDSLEIQAYDPVLFPGLASELGESRPLVGSITLQLPTSDDAAVDAWIDDGTPPVYFGFGSMPLDDPAQAVEMITTVTAELGVRALICSGVLQIADSPRPAHVKIVRTVHHASVFPRCRAVVHHGGAGTTAASVRAGVPTLVLWVGADQMIWGAQVKRLGIGSTRRFTLTTAKSLRADLQKVLAPRYATRAREVAGRMIPPGRSLTMTADLIERAAERRTR